MHAIVGGAEPLRREDVDVCIIGSGAGGSLMAREAAVRGLRTLVLERGPRVSAAEMDDSELTMIPRIYKDGGLQLNTAMDLFILQGSCVGGSTVLSNMVMIRPDRDVVERWRGLGLKVAWSDIVSQFERIERELEAKPARSENVSGTSRAFLQGAHELGLHPAWMNKALGSCVGCGLCNIGCVFDTKRSALTTYLPSAERDGARVIADADVTALVHSKGRVAKARVRVGRGRERLEVRARLFIVAAGAIGSSALLLASGVKKNVGTRLSFNAGAMMVGEFDEPLDGWDADQMTVYLPGEGWLIEATHNPPMSAALTTPGWRGEHGALMAKSRQLAYAGGMVGTEPVGRVVMSLFFGHEEVRFRMTEGDLGKLRDSLKTIARVYFAAGARRVYLPTHELRALESLDDLPLIDELVRNTKHFSCGSAHPQGGNPASDDPELGAVDSDLMVHGFDNLAVCDASVFPSTIGVNPIEMILATVGNAAPRVLARA